MVGHAPLEIHDVELMERALSDGRNIQLTQNHVLVTNYHGVTVGGKIPPIWRDFFEQCLASKRKGTNTASSNFTTEFLGGRYRCCLANSQKGWLIAMRNLPAKVPAMRDDLGLDWQVIKPLLEGSGLTLFAGRIGSGKSTTMAAAIGNLDPLAAQIATLEDPIEVIHPGHSIIQREVGTHVESFPEGIRDCVRQNRTTIVVSEIRDSETANAALLAASTGHSVLATIHADSVFDIYTRMFALIDERYARVLARNLRGFWWQHIVRFGDVRRKPVPIFESLLVNTEVRNIFDKGPEALPMLAAAMSNQKRKTMSECAIGHIQNNRASRDELFEFVQRRDRVGE